ncbi:alkaline phosphatase family protein [Gordonia sp. DT219]|uniref:alkaline phosphatase family protein n=1 Tax=Gordonia sp. DT219 TaxID=3416658 RepID=UPI003CED9359
MGHKRSKSRVRLIGGAAAIVATALVASACGSDSSDSASSSGAAAADKGKHVLLLSVDGLHQADLVAYVGKHPDSALAALTKRGTEFTNAQTPILSDSFPGTVGQVTGGNPQTTGIYYDDSFDRTLLAPGTTQCAGAKTGGHMELTEELDKDTHRIDAGQGLANLPDSVGGMTAAPQNLLDPAKLPVDPNTCKPVQPWNLLRVNTIFGVAHGAGLRTAWSDKHPAYSILAGPGDGTTIDDLFTPEIDSSVDGTEDGKTWASDNGLTQRYDTYKVTALLNEIEGKDHSGKNSVGVPAIFGMNFQSVSTAQKLPTSGGQRGGYEPDGVTPGPVLASALDFVNTQVGKLLDKLKAAGAEQSTTVVLTSKHGQSPTKPGDFRRIDDGKIVDDVNAAWAAGHPGAPKLVEHSVNDDVMLWWLSDRSEAAQQLVRERLGAASGTGYDINGNPVPYVKAGLAQVKVGADAAAYFGVPVTDSRVPDVVGLVDPGVVYAGKPSKIAEHGGSQATDRDVPLIVAGPGFAAATSDQQVETTQIAPTVLTALGLDPNQLQAVRAEGTKALQK